MNTNISLIAIKLFGVYLGFSFFRSLPEAMFLLFMKKSDAMPSLLPYYIITIVYLLIYLSVALLFIFKTHSLIKLLNLPDEKTEVFTESLKNPVLLIGLILIGLYFLFSSLPFIISFGITFIPGTPLNMRYSGSDLWARCGEKFITAILSLILIAKSKAIGAYLLRIISKDSQLKD